MHRGVARFVLAVVGLLGALVVLAGPAHAAGNSITAIVTDADKAPIAGVVVNVSGADGFTGTGKTGADGKATIAVPKGGKYEVSLDEATIPGGAKVKDGPTRTINVLVGDAKALFPVGVPDSGGGGGGGSGTITLDRVLQLLLDGLVLSLLIALGALGLNLIFGTTGLSNFAHGELLTLGAFTVFVLNVWLNINLLIAAPLGLIISAGLWGWGQNQILWKPLRKRKTGLIAAMIVSIGLAITLRYTILFIFGGAPKSYAQYAGQAGIDLGPVFITPKAIVLSLIAIVALTLTVVWLRSSRIGKATRAVSDNPALASASGVNVERVISVVWIIGATLAALAGIFLGMTQNVVWTMGQYLLLTMFAAIVLGGLGTIGGALVGSLVVGVTVQLSTLIVPTELKTGAALVLMIVLLLVRPQGLLGRPERVG
ncbi:MAG: ABC transporter permease subunit [Candidatus Nanopelagicales bacterium]